MVTQSTNVYVLLLPRISLCHQLTHVEKERERRVGRERVIERQREGRDRETVYSCACVLIARIIYCPVS